MLHLWGRLSSINVRKVAMGLQELGLPFRRTDAGAAFGLTRTPEYLRANPNALVPLLDDDGFTLWESNVILRYLAVKAGSPLMPTALRERFDVERWMDWQQTTFNPAGRDAFVQLIRQPGGRADADKVAASVAATEPLLDLLDQHLATHRFIAGDHYTVADIPLACEMHRWTGLPLSQRPRPHLDAWYGAVRARPAAKGILDLTLT